MIKLIKNYLIILKIFSLLFLLSNCSSTKSNKDISQLSDKEIYSKALTLFQKGNQNFEAKSKFQTSREKALKRSKKLDKKISNLLIGNNMSNNSKYFSEYQKTMSAMQQLETKIKSHPKFQENDLLLNSENKLESLNVFIDKLESELSVLALKEQVLTKMAKLVSLDAMELADSLQINISQSNEFKDVNDPTDSVNLFLN